MGSEWKTVRLNEVATLRNGAGVKQQFFADNGIPLARVSDFTLDSIDISDCKYVEQAHAETWTSHYIDVGDVLVSTVGSWPPNWSSVVGKVVRAPANVSGAIQNQNTCCILPNQAVLDNRYLFYRLKSEDFTWHTSNNAGGSANQARLPVKKLGEFQFLLPPLSVQRLIANILGVLDDKITLNSQINQTLEQMAQTLFKSWFVDFDPVKAKMNGEQSKGIDAPFLSKEVASLFPEKLVESELGLIPEGWEVTKLSKVIDLLNGFAFKSPDYVKEGTFVLRTKNFDSSNSVERLGDDVYLPDEFLESHKKYLCEAYDYHVVMVAASIGKTAMIYPHQLPALRNQNMWCFRPKDESLRFYTKYMVDGLVKLNMGLASGSARAFFKKGDFNSYGFALPSSELLVKFNDVVGNLVKQKGSLLNQNVQLAAMRDTLLPKLLSGEIDLENLQVEQAIAIAE